MKKKKSSLTRAQIVSIFETFAQHNPNPQIELKHNNNFTLLIAVLLSAQATDRSVNLANKDIFDVYNTPEAMLMLGQEELEKKIKTIGLYRTKAKNIIKLCHMLIKNHESQVPKNFDLLMELPGVGRKTADVVLNSAFGLPRIAVDRHIYRIVHRIGITSGKNTDQVADNLIEILPKKYHKNAHHWLVLHGRYVCKAQNPNCKNCIISQLCIYGNKKS